MFCMDPKRVAAAYATANGDPNKIPVPIPFLTPNYQIARQGCETG